MKVDQALRIVQTTYPQIYLACHTQHQRKRTTEHALSSRDASILAHLDEVRPMPPGQLARHLSISRSTMSEALKHLVSVGFAARSAPRSASVVLTQKGVRAVRDTSVLEHKRLHAVLTRLTTRERGLICAGFGLLARACQPGARRRS